jgi:hypothetical protein
MENDEIQGRAIEAEHIEPDSDLNEFNDEEGELELG